MPPSGCAGYTPFPCQTLTSQDRRPHNPRPPGGRRSGIAVRLPMNVLILRARQATMQAMPTLLSIGTTRHISPITVQPPTGAFQVNGSGESKGDAWFPEYEQDNVWMVNQGTFAWNCDSNYQEPAAGDAPRFAIAGSIPASITLPKLDPFSSAYGLPIMRVYNGVNRSPNFYTTITASSVDPAGGSATFPLPSSLHRALMLS